MAGKVELGPGVQDHAIAGSRLPPRPLTVMYAGGGGHHTDGDDASGEESSSEEGFWSDFDEVSGKARKMYDPFDPPSCITEGSLLPWHRWARMYERIKGMPAGRRREMLEGQILDKEQELLDVQMAKLHPLYTRATDVGTEVDWVQETMPKAARRERAHLRAIVLAKGLIMRVVAQFAS